jgi:hypothetical protein
LIASFLAVSAQEANCARSSHWGITQWADLLRLNVGTPEVMTTATDEIRVLVRLDSLPLAVSRMPGVDVQPSPYRSIPGAGICIISNPSHKDLETLLDLVRIPHLELVRQAARTRINGATRRAHSREAIEELARITGLALQQPSYVPDNGASAAQDV